MTVTESLLKSNGTVRVSIFIEYFNFIDNLYLVKILNDLFLIDECLDE